MPDKTKAILRRKCPIAPWKNQNGPNLNHQCMQLSIATNGAVCDSFVGPSFFIYSSTNDTSFWFLFANALATAALQQTEGQGILVPNYNPPLLNTLPGLELYKHALGTQHLDKTTEQQSFRMMSLCVYSIHKERKVLWVNCMIGRPSIRCRVEAA
eukprot:scaffold86_cov338-Pavlova_lutheri.AAC.107